MEGPLSQIAVDGGVTNSDYIMQNIADITGISVVRAKNIEATTLGAAYAAGLASGYWKSFDEIESSGSWTARAAPLCRKCRRRSGRAVIRAGRKSFRPSCNMQNKE